MILFTRLYFRDLDKHCDLFLGGKSRIRETKNLLTDAVSSTTSFRQGLSKNLTAQDTRATPTLTKHNRTLGYLLSLKPRSTIKVFFFKSPYYSVNWSKTRYSSQLVTTISSFSFPKTKWNNTVGLQFDHSLSMATSYTPLHSPLILPSSSIWNT